MARNKIGLQLEGFEELIEKLDEIGGGDAMKNGVEKALIASKEYVTPQIENAINRGNLPAKGKYSTGRTKKSIDKESSVEWSAMTATAKIGFDFSKSGVTSIFLMYGTPKMKPVSGLKNAIYGTKTQKKIAELQGEALDEVIKDIMGG